MKAPSGASPTFSFVGCSAENSAGAGSIEYEGIICEVLRRQLLPSRHHFERINLHRCVGNAGFALWECPSCGESDDRGGGGDCE